MMANSKKKKKNPYRGETWVGLYPRKTKTKKEKIESSERKHKNKNAEE